MCVCVCVCKNCVLEKWYWKNIESMTVSQKDDGRYNNSELIMISWSNQ